MDATNPTAIVNTNRASRDVSLDTERLRLLSMHEIEAILEETRATQAIRRVRVSDAVTEEHDVQTAPGSPSWVVNERLAIGLTVLAGWMGTLLTVLVIVKLTH